MTAKDKAQKLDRDASLKAVPIRNQLAKVEELEGGKVRISVPIRETWWTRILQRLTKAPKYKKIELDEVGTFVWKQCDGNTNVAAVVDRLCKRYNLSHRESEVSLTQYLRDLARRGVIGLGVSPEHLKKNR